MSSRSASCPSAAESPPPRCASTSAKGSSTAAAPPATSAATPATRSAGSPSSAPRSGVGIPLSRIRGVLSLLPRGPRPTKEDWARISECWRADLNERIEQLENLRDRLTDCIGCGCLSIDKCALANPYDQLGEQGAGARRLLKSCC